MIESKTWCYQCGQGFNRDELMLIGGILFVAWKHYHDDPRQEAEVWGRVEGILQRIHDLLPDEDE